MGLALLSRHFEKSRLPEEMSRLLANDWKGGFVLLVVVAVISSVLDNIAAAFIGSPMAHKGFCGKVHLGYLTGIVATSNAAGSGSVVGDTTSSPLSVLEALVAASVPLVLFGSPATIQRRRYSPNRRECSSSPSSRLQRSPPTYPSFQRQSQPGTATAWLARRRGLYHRVLRHAVAARLASRPATQPIPCNPRRRGNLLRSLAGNSTYCFGVPEGAPGDPPTADAPPLDDAASPPVVSGGAVGKPKGLLDGPAPGRPKGGGPRFKPEGPGGRPLGPVGRFRPPGPPPNCGS
jgi:hypothetical protein